MEAHERIVPVEGIHNLRHMGGYRTRTGRVTSPDLIRAASLHRMTEDEAGELARIGVRTVIDFRSEGERKELATPALAHHGIAMVEAAVFQSDASPVALEGEFPGFAVVYQTFLETGETAYRMLAETIASTEGRLIFHCAAGKDRTGVAAALLLDLVGVEDSDILSDYALSASLLAPMLPEWMAGMAARGLDPSRAERMLASEPEDMAFLLGHLRERWGSASGYFREVGVNQDTIRTVRAAYSASVERPAGRSGATGGVGDTLKRSSLLESNERVAASPGRTRQVSATLTVLHPPGVACRRDDQPW